MDVTERQIADLVRRFYDSARSDPALGPLFAAAIQDWDGHMEIVADFWSHTLLGTDRYKGTPYAAHTRLPIIPAHFDRWLALFSAAADATLPPEAAAQAKGRATQMTESFRVGLFPYLGPDGQPTRMPPRQS